ncbi:MAG: NADH-quinone oxidoreductase subunit [Acidimicrobiaceae bacterium]
MDPLFNEGLDVGVVAIVLIKTLIVFAFLLIATMLMVWFERKVIGDMQNRIGPNRAGPWGILQTLADGIKLFFKEPMVPERADPLIFRIAPYLSFVPAFLTFSIVPIGGVFGGGHDGTIEIFSHDTYLQLADPPIGILVALACSSIAVYGVMLAGWSSGSKYPLLGSVRASAQMVSYEAALGLAVVTVVLTTGTLSTHGIVVEQAGSGPGDILPNWTILVTGFIPFFIFLLAGTAEIERPPFDLLEADQELVAGFNTEYSGIRFALFYLASFMNTITTSAIIVTLFLGGPSGPLLFGPDWIWPLIWFFGKVIVFLFIFVWFRATLPRYRYDQLMDLGWKVMIPLALGWMLVVAAIRIASDRGWNVGIVVAIGGVTIVTAASLLAAARRTAGRRRDEALEPEGAPR